MSADNWEVCPRCYNRALKEFEDVKAKIADLGADVKKFMNIKEPSIEDYRTFREDYEFSLEDGKVRYSYSGACVYWDRPKHTGSVATEKGCGLSCHFTGSQPLEGIND